MATLNLTTKEFADVAMIWLLDQVVNSERITNEQFAEFIEKHKNKLKAPLLNYFLNTSPARRLDYRRISKIFSGNEKQVQQIRIGPDDFFEDDDEKKDGVIKKVLKKMLKKEETELTDEFIKKMLKKEETELTDEDRLKIWEKTY